MPRAKDNSSREIVVNEVIAHLGHFTKLYGITSLFVVGGYCRDKLFGKIWDVNDIDVASAYPEQALQLGGLFASEIIKSIPKFYKRTGTAAMEYKSELGSIKVEFQGTSTSQYMHNETVRSWIHDNNVDDVPLMNNIYGRDFTMNSMIFSLPENKLYDPTGRAAQDIKRRMITSLLPAEMLVKYNPLSILRAIRFSLVYDFHIDVDLRVAMKENIDTLARNLSEDRIMKEIIRILQLNPKEGLSMLKKFGLDKFLLNEDITKYLDLELKK